VLVSEHDSHALLFSSNLAFAQIVHLNTYQRVSLDIDTDIVTLLIVVSRLSTVLVSRLVFNLREQNSTLVHLPPTIETERRFQVALPVAQQPMSSVGNVPSAYPQNSTYEILADAISTAGASHSSQTADSVPV